jgi:hypothetical protein
VRERKLRETPPPNSKLERLAIRRGAVPSVLADHILILARGFLDTPNLDRIFKEAGRYKLFGFQNGEYKAIIERTVELIDEHSLPELEWDNAFVSWALARQYHLGTIAISDDQAGREFSNDRIRKFPFMENRKRPDIRIKLSEMLEIYDAFRLNHPEYIELVQLMNNAKNIPEKDTILVDFGIDPEPGHLLNSTIRNRCETICYIVFGFANKVSSEWTISFANFFGDFAYHNDPPNMSRESYLEYLRSPLQMKRYRSTRSDMVDESLPKFINDLDELDRET